MRARILPALALLALLALGRAAGAEEKVRLGYNANSARNIASLVLHVIERKALFANEGLAVELVGLPGTTAMVDALDNGTVDVTGTATP
jgi:ABC-type nitrate/sulfonate/bicarbonate transport system substrate-binding protein